MVSLLTEEFTVNTPEYAGVDGAYRYHMACITQQGPLPLCHPSDHPDSKEDKGVTRVTEDHAEEDRKENAEVGGGVKRGVAREGEQACEDFEGPEISRVVQDYGDILELMIFDLKLLQRDLPVIGLINQVIKRLQVSVGDPSRHHETPVRFENVGLVCMQSQALQEPFTATPVVWAPP